MKCRKVLNLMRAVAGYVYIPDFVCKRLNDNVSVCGRVDGHDYTFEMGVGGETTRWGSALIGLQC